jgi:hypothetical protein
MRLSCLAITILLLVASPTPFAQHSSSASSSGGGSHSSAASFGGSGSGHASFASPGASHISGSLSSRGGAPAARNNLAPTASRPAATEKKHFSFPWHKKSSPQLASWRPTPCFHGRNCTPCQAGSRSGVGMCTPQPRNVSCFAGQVWNGSYCAAQNWWLNDCLGVAGQLEAQRRHMQGLNDPGQSLVYQALRSQYLSCLSRQGFGLGFYALNDMNPFNIP